MSDANESTGGDYRTESPSRGASNTQEAIDVSGKVVPVIGPAPVFKVSRGVSSVCEVPDEIIKAIDDFVVLAGYHRGACGNVEVPGPIKVG